MSSYQQSKHGYKHICCHWYIFIPTVIDFILCIAPFGPPANITPTFLGSGNVSLSWDPPDGPVYGYQLFYTQANGSEMGIVRMVNISNMNTSVILYGLEAAATYSIQMLAYADLPTTMSEAIEVTLNGMYCSSSSTLVSSLSVAGIPQNIKLTHIPSNATSILVMWNPPNSSSVVGYIINYSPADDINSKQNSACLHYDIPYRLSR